ncbi:MAG: DUF3073 family protein, partial [Actinobacteria bacterium]|nr:DUF3073 family protein [Actinomycetota bacterium]
LKYSSQDMDLERLAKELHGEVDPNKGFDEQDPYSEDTYKPRS